MKTDTKKPLIVYHDPCPDGFTSAWAAWSAQGNTVDYYPAEHGKPFLADCADRKVIMLDFVPSQPGVMERVLDQAESVKVIDHHQGAFKRMNKLVASDRRLWYVFDNDHSGAWLAWQEFHGAAAVPTLVRYVEDKDLFVWKLPFSHEVNAYIASQPFDFPTWQQLHWRLREPLIESSPIVASGRAILQFQERQLEEIVRVSKEIIFTGHKVMAANTSVFMGEASTALAKGRPFGISWFLRNDGKIKVSLRSENGGIDVSAIARQFGGNGHVHAAGFETAPQELSFLTGA